MSGNPHGRLGAPLDITAMLQAKQAGATYRDIARTFGISVSCAYRRLQSHARRVAAKGAA